MFHLKIFAFFVLGLIALALGAPVVQHDAYEQTLVPRNNAKFKQAASVMRQINRKLKDFKPGEVIFHSGVKGYDKKTGKKIFVKQDAVKIGKPKGQVPLSHHLVKNKIWIPPTRQNKYSSRLWEFASKKAAQRATGPTMAVVAARRPNNVYDKIEKPALMKNPNVPQLTEYNVVTRKTEIVKGKK